MLLLTVLFEIVHIGNCRSERQSAFKLSPLRSPILLAGIAIAFLVHMGMMYAPLGNQLLSTQPIALKIWGLLIALSLTVLLPVELSKVIRDRAWRRRNIQRH